MNCQTAVILITLRGLLPQWSSHRCPKLSSETLGLLTVKHNMLILLFNFCREGLGFLLISFLGWFSSLVTSEWKECCDRCLMVSKASQIMSFLMLPNRGYIRLYPSLTGKWFIVREWWTQHGGVASGNGICDVGVCSTLCLAWPVRVEMSRQLWLGRISFRSSKTVVSQHCVRTTTPSASNRTTGTPQSFHGSRICERGVL